MTDLSKPFPVSDHDHSRCIDDALAAAEALCARHNLRLTDLRRRVLQLVWTRHGPVGAYALLDALKEEGYAAAPPTVYRALDFLLEHGLVHRIERLNAFVGCPQPGVPHIGQFLICSACGAAAEIDDPGIVHALRQGAALRGFRIEHQTVEVTGLCPACQAGGQAHDH